MTEVSIFSIPADNAKNTPYKIGGNPFINY